MAAKAEAEMEAIIRHDKYEISIGYADLNMKCEIYCRNKKIIKWYILFGSFAFTFACSEHCGEYAKDDFLS